MLDDIAIGKLVSVFHAGHVRTLEHLESVMIITGWDRYDDDLQELEEWGLVIGKWFGSLKYPASPLWELSSEGRKALQLHYNKSIQG